MFKIETYIPKESLNNIIDAVKDYCKVDSNKYIHCMSWHTVNSMWMPINDADPFLGELNKDQFAEEYVLTFRCDENSINIVKSLIIKNHPYEVPCIDVYKLEKF